MVLLEQSGLPAGLEVHQLLVGREIGVDPRGDPVKVYTVGMPDLNTSNTHYQTLAVGASQAL